MSPGPSRSSVSFVYPAACAKLRTSPAVQDEGLSAIWRKELRQAAEAQQRRPHSTQPRSAASPLRQTAQAFEHEGQYAGSDLCRSSTALLHFSDPQQPLPHCAQRPPQTELINLKHSAQASGGSASALARTAVMSTPLYAGCRLWTMRSISSTTTYTTKRSHEHTDTRGWGQASEHKGGSIHLASAVGDDELLEDLFTRVVRIPPALLAAKDELHNVVKPTTSPW